MGSKSSTASGGSGRWFALFFVLLTGILVALFYGGFLPGHNLFSNDGPLGAQKSRFMEMPERFIGSWADLNSVGFDFGGAWPNLTNLIWWWLGPVGYSKFYEPMGLLVLGLGAWCFLRQLGLAPVACLLGGLAAALNSGFFSAACWGVAAHPITVGLTFLAMAALWDTTSKQRWLRVWVAGAAVGVGVSEGADIGAIFSLFVAAFVLYQSWSEEGSAVTRLVKGASRLALVAAVAMVVAWQTVSSLVAANIVGVAGAQQDTRSREDRWDWATQWSLPKREALGLIIPGLFGYRMDTANGGNYWGAVGRDPAWDRYFEEARTNPKAQPPGGFLRFTGGGNYAGILVGLIAVWAILQGMRKKDSAFVPGTRRWIWFWSGIAGIALLLAFGRFAPFYRLLYALPYFSTIRNPAKFVHVFNWAFVILFAYGVNGLWRRYLEAPAVAGAGAGLKAWWQQVRGFDRRWTLGSVGALGAGMLACLIYSSNQDGLVKYLQSVGFEPAMSQAIARFSLGQAVWFILFFAVAVGLVILVLSGMWNGRRAWWAGTALLLFLVADLVRANLPWVIVWDYEQKYASNPIVEFLAQKSHEQRVAVLPEWVNRSLRLSPQLELVNQLYRIEWAQHHFLYYNVQSLDVVQMPRVPEDLAAFEGVLQPRSLADVPRLVTRRWQLTNTRYLVGPAGRAGVDPDVLGFLNDQVDPGRHRFRIAQRFQIVAKPGVLEPTRLEEFTAVADTNGPFAVFEFTGALPRAKLYSNWLVSTNDQGTLGQLAGGSFDPEQTVLVSGDVPPPDAAAPTNAPASTVEFVSYAPKHIQFKANAAAPSVLLVNDHYHPGWKVLVDGKPMPLLRCNYLMRGVYLPPGAHQVEFRFHSSVRALYVSLAGIGATLLVCGLLLIVRGTRAGQDSLVNR